MHSAFLENGNLITAKEYIPDLHGVQLFCLDKVCRVPLIFVQGNDDVSPHFKTSGKNDSVHKKNCGFSRKLSFQESVNKVAEFQQDLKNKGSKELLIRLNLNAIDPDYVAKSIERDEKEKDPTNQEEIKVKKDSGTPQSIGSLKAVKKLFLGYEPDILASIIISVKGKKIAISELIRSHEESHKALWEFNTYENVPYFVHGTVERIIRRDKVWFIKFDSSFSLVVFDRYFKHFTYKDDQLIGKNILAYGYLKKNNYNPDKPSTEMIIKSNKYLEFL
ncbi:hypothetical protein [Bacillus cihuensis]|uniref:hypothetical protein n=1 Tax=Bacillus cihuensis TaxID=1208599 RepID=UPI0003FC8FD4|nr:hypothetical protein [Bacillus cihuensis]